MIVHWKRFYEIQLRLQGAEEQLNWLNRIIGESPPAELIENSTLSQLHPLQESFDLIGADIRRHIGLFAHELRSALNYMTVQLAEHDCGSIGRNVQFPIEDDPVVFESHRASYLEGLSSEHVAFIEGFQPYHAQHARLKSLRDWSNMDKHHGLIKVDKTVRLLSNGDLDPHFTFQDGSPIVPKLESICVEVFSLTEQYRVLTR